MGKLILIFSILLSVNTNGFLVENIFQDDLTIVDTLSYNFSSEGKSSSNSKDFDNYLNDPKNIVSNDFKVPAQLKQRTKFWFDIYTKYDSSFSVLHDIESPYFVYDVVDFSDLKSSQLNKNTRYSLQNKSMQEVIKKYKAAFTLLGRKDCFTDECKKILNTLKENNINIPNNQSARRKLFNNLSNNLRTQTGQKDHILQGLDNLKGYYETIEKMFKVFEMPHELLAVSFLESSFNIHATSKVGATGPWQFMKFIGKHFMTMNNFADQRKSAILSTSGALHLLAQNKKIMGTWDLAVNAYNSGTGTLRLGIKNLKGRGFSEPRVWHLIDHFKHPAWGFAAKNFYSEFLALVHVLAYKNEIYDINFKEHDGLIDIYVTKCKIPLLKLIKTIKSTEHNLYTINNHLNRKYQKSHFPKGTVFLSDVELTDKKYHKIEFSELRRRYPKNLHKFASDQSCSSK